MVLNRTVEVVPWGPILHDTLSKLLEEHERNPDRIGAPLVVMPSDEGQRTLLKSVQQRMQSPIDASRVTTIRGLAQRCLLDLEIHDPLNPLMAEELVIGLSVAGLDDSMRWRLRDEYILYQSLLKEGILKEKAIGDIDLSHVDRSLRTIQQRTGKTIFEVQMRDLIQQLEDGTVPFTLLHASEIILVHVPSLTSGQMLKFLRSLRHHVHIHEICAPGSLRDGRAGIRLWSESISTERFSTNRTSKSTSPEFFDIGTEGSDGEIASSLSIIQACLSHSSPSFPSLTIVDWAYDRRKDMWERQLLAAGCWEFLPEHKVGPSLRHLVETATSADAWSRTRIRRLARDPMLNSVFSTLIQEADLSHSFQIELDSNEVSEIGGVHHIVGGSGALGAWLDILDSPLRSDIHPRRRVARQSTQLALHALAHLLAPWLTLSDRQRLSEQVVGCHDREIYHFQPPLETPEESISLLVQACPGQGTSNDILETQKSIQKLTRFESLLGIDGGLNPMSWTNRFFRVLEDYPSSKHHRHYVEVLSPEQAMGSKSDVLIIAGLSTEHSSTTLLAPPLLDVEQAIALGFKGPRATLGAHLQTMDLCFSSSAKVLILNPSADGTTPLSLAAQNLLSTVSFGEPDDWIKNAPGMYTNHNQLIHSRWKTHGRHLLPTSNSHSHRRARLGVMAREGKILDPLHRPVNNRSVAFPYDALMLKNNLGNQPSLAEVNEIYLFPERHSSIWSLSGLTLTPSSRNVVQFLPEQQPANLAPGVLLGGRSPNGYNNPSRDPRPLRPRVSGVTTHDSRMGHGPEMNLSRWSASSLRSWMECPRRAWMTRVLHVQSSDSLDDGVAGHRVGNLLHRAWAETIADTLGFGLSNEREIGGLDCLSPSDHDIESIINDLTSRLIRQEPWLRSGDAGAAALHRHLFAQDPWPMEHINDDEVLMPTIGGIVRDLVETEFYLEPHRVLSLEHRFTTPSTESNIIGQGRSIHGAIDRVELLPFPSSKWINRDAPASIVPLGPERAQCVPRRCIMIRDIKFVQSTVDRSHPRNRWLKMIFEDVQLALYARAWEVNNPGDMVVGVGGVIIGAKVDHFSIKRLSHHNSDDSDFGLSMMHGLASSGHEDPFDGWLQERISIAKSVVDAANEGRIPPTPGHVCSHCPVISACEVSHREDMI